MSKPKSVKPVTADKPENIHPSEPDAAPAAPAAPAASLLPVKNIPSGMALAAIFGTTAAFSVKVKRLSLPPIIKPSDLSANPNAVVMGTLRAVKDSPKKTFKTKMLEMEHPSGKRFMICATATVESALVEEFKSLEGAIGQKLAFQGMGKKAHSDGVRTVNIIDVMVLEAFPVEQPA